jgi:uracil-DNA glycosylase
MAFIETSQIEATHLKQTINLDSIRSEIQKNKELSELAPEPGKRPLPVGHSSPFMVVGQAPSKLDVKEFFEDPALSKYIDEICEHVGLKRDDLYLTYAFKYPFEGEEPYFKDGKAHIRQFLYKEILAVNPDILFVIGKWTQKLFEKTFLFEFKGGLQKVLLQLQIEDHKLEYETWIYPVDSIEDIEQFDKVKDLIDKVKINWKFVHLHVHDSLSFKDGIGTPESRVMLHYSRKKPAISITNHGNICSWISVYEGAKKYGMKPILGVEGYVNRFADDLQGALKDDSPESKQKRKELSKKGFHCTLFAKNIIGFKNLVHIHNDAWVNRFYRNPIMSANEIKANHQGLIVLSGCSSGEQNRIISEKYFLMSDQRKTQLDQLVENKVNSMRGLMRTKNDEKYSEDEYLDDWDFKWFYAHQEEKKFDEELYRKEALEFVIKSDKEKIESADKKVREIVDWWKTLMGDDYYIELMVIDFSLQKQINQELIKVAKEKGIKLVITNDCHYPTRTDAELQEVQMLSDQNKTLDELKADTEGKIWTIKSKELYYKSVDELHDAWEQWHKSDIFTEEVFWEAIYNTVDLVEKKFENYTLDRSTKLPKIYEDSKSVLAKKIAQGLKDRGLDGNQTYKDRALFEFKVIAEKGYVDYFLIMEDIIGWTKKTYGDLSVGPGRGCFVPETEVRMADDSFKKISDVKKNDEVTSGWGSKRKVKNVLVYDVNENLTKINLKNGDSIDCTNDHEILVIPKGKEKNIKNAIWKKASELKEGDSLVKDV